MSKRRGKVRVDALSEERRHWYSDLQEPGIKSFKEYEHVHQESKPVQNRHYYLDDDDDDSATGRVLALEDRAFNKYADVKPNVWIKSLNNVRSKTSVLICFHGVGNNHSYFKKWGKSLSTSGISLYSITVPGHMNRFNEPMSMSFVEMANFIYLSAKALRIMEGNDVILFGHCSGAIIAYEVARLMQKDGLSSLRQLIVSSAISPLVQTAYNKNKRGVIKYFLQSDKDLIERVKLMGGMVDDNFTTAPMNLMKHNLKMIRRDFLIQEKYLIHLMDDPLYDIGLHSHNTSAVVSSAASVASAGKGSVGSAVNVSSANHSFSGSVDSGANKNASNKATPNVSAKGSVNNSAANSIVHSNHNTGRAGSPAKSAAASQHNSAASSRFPSTTHTASSHNHHHNSSAASVSSGLKSHTGSFNGTVDDLDSAFSRGSKKKDDDSSSEEEEDFYIPPVLYKLRVPIATILAVDNQIVELKDVNAWSELTSSYNHIAIHDGGHNYLRLKENRTEVLGLIEKAFSNGQL